MLVEAGDRQPHTLANAFRDAVPDLDGNANGIGTLTARALATYLGEIDKAYATGEKRRHMALPDFVLTGVDRVDIVDLAAWAGDVVRTASVP